MEMVQKCREENNRIATHMVIYDAPLIPQAPSRLREMLFRNCPEINSLLLNRARIGV